ncbi:MAG: bifunctional DNA-formamidopyrimidine glycosylase/DNA-(apurinic or apyrimidinic site) lyase [Gammaproteobacteria bacterium]
MPELPEVETTRRGIAPYVEQQRVCELIVREPRLRWPVTENLPQLLRGAQLQQVERRAKYLLFAFDRGTLLVHLGMSGSLRIVAPNNEAGKHDHVDVLFANGRVLRLTDPRRFGALLWLGEQAQQHPLLRDLGPEPLSAECIGAWLYRRSRSKKLAVKQFIMDQKVIVGVGNIYANEALFAAGIRPTVAAGKISSARYEVLADAIRSILAQAIAQGGTTLRDFVGGDGKPGYFQQQLHVYGRAGLPCTRCGRLLKEVRLSGRSSVYCGHCQR